MRRPTRNLLYVVLGLVCVALLVQGVGLQIPKVLKVLSLSTPAGPEARIEPSEVAGITTSKASYTPGELVTIAGSGWQPGEVVTVLLQEEPQIHDDVTLDLTADASGRILYEYTAEEHDGVVRLYVTAKGGLSSAGTLAVSERDGHLALMRFMDQRHPQCAKLALQRRPERSSAGGMAGSGRRPDGCPMCYSGRVHSGRTGRGPHCRLHLRSEEGRRSRLRFRH